MVDYVDADTLLERLIEEVRARARDAAIFAGEGDKITILTTARDQAFEREEACRKQLHQITPERDQLLTALTALLDALNHQSGATDHASREAAAKKVIDARVVAAALIEKLDPIPF